MSCFVDALNIIKHLLSLPLCNGVKKTLQKYAHFIRENQERVYTLTQVSHQMLSQVGKAIHRENYTSVADFFCYLERFFQVFQTYLVSYLAIPKDQRREQDTERYALVCNDWFVHSTPCFELLYELIEQAHQTLAPRAQNVERTFSQWIQEDLAAKKKVGLLKRELRPLSGEIFCARLLRGFQSFLCYIYDGSCNRADKRIEQMYTLENLFDFIFAAHLQHLDALEDIDFVDELEETLAKYDLGFENGVDYLLAKVCC